MAIAPSAPGAVHDALEVIITAELDQRPARAPDFRSENQALVALTKTLRNPGANMLQKLAAVAMELCQAHSAAVGIVEVEQGREVLRWHGAAGQWSGYLGAASLCDGSPFGVVLDRNTPLLMGYPDRRFTCGLAAAPPLAEILLVPLRVERDTIGVVCVMAHDDSRHFDREDLRLLMSLSDFASTVRRILQPAEQLWEALEQERANSRLLQEISAALIRENDGSLLFGQILDAAMSIMSSDFGSMQVVRGNSNVLQLLAWRGFHPKTARFWRQVHISSWSACDHPVRTKKHWIVTDTESCKLLAGTADLDEYRRSGIRSLQATPLISRSDCVLGVLSTHWREPHEPTTTELRFLDVLARLAADLLERTKTEERQAFLLRLSDALRPLDNPLAVQERATELLGNYLQVNRVAFAVTEPNDEIMSIARDWRQVGAPALLGRYPVDGFSKFFGMTLHNGGVSVVEDAMTDPRAPRSNCGETWRTVHTRAAIAYALARQGRFVGAIFVDQNTPRQWTESEIAIVREVGERTWEAIEHARTEAALRDSEERFRQFANASSDALWIRDAKTFGMEYASPAAQSVYGVSPEQLLGALDLWSALLIPDDRAAAIEHLTQARVEPVVHEYRIQRPTDRTFRWIRSTEFPLFDEQGRVQRVAGIVSDITEVKRSAEHQAVLVAELQHRVRNMMAMIRSIATRTAASAQSAAEHAALLAGRLLTLARVQTLLTRSDNRGVSIRAILRDQLGALAQREDQFETVGDDIVISPKAAEVVTLAIHELTTNALKYGALSTPEGRIRVTWSRNEKPGITWLAIDWVEHFEPPPPLTSTSQSPRRGFGTELIEDRVPYELGGHGSITIENGRAHCRLEFPLQEHASILETDAPKAARVDGGTLDMRGAPDLTGQRILIVEDDYCLAMDAARAIQGAGGEVLGPYSTDAVAHEEFADGLPTGALLDVNPESGPSLTLARSLKEYAIPLVFIMGCAGELIPPELIGMPRLQKPADLRRLVTAMADAVAAGQS